MKLAPITTELVCVITICIAVQASGACVSTDEKTIWGGNERIEMREKKPLSRVHGMVVQNLDTHEPWSDVLVEVYEHPLHSSSPAEPSDKRIAGCKTDKTGAFSFDVPSGDYELRFSYSSAYNVTSVLVRLRNKVFTSKRKLVVQLLPGT